MTRARPTGKSSRAGAAPWRRRALVHVARAEDIDCAAATSADRTALDCLLRTLPLRPRPLAVADSAPRVAGSPRGRLASLAAALARGPSLGSAPTRSPPTPTRVRPTRSSPGSARRSCHERPGPRRRSRRSATPRGRTSSADPDLVDQRLRIVLEADSFEWHGSRRRLSQRDARRYNGFALAGWLVLRFTWEDVVREPDGVRSALPDCRSRRAMLAQTARQGAGRVRPGTTLRPAARSAASAPGRPRGRARSRLSWSSGLAARAPASLSSGSRDLVGERVVDRRVVLRGRGRGRSGVRPRRRRWRRRRRGWARPARCRGRAWGRARCRPLMTVLRSSETVGEVRRRRYPIAGSSATRSCGTTGSGRSSSAAPAQLGALLRLDDRAARRSRCGR